MTQLTMAIVGEGVGISRKSLSEENHEEKILLTGEGA